MNTTIPPSPVSPCDAPPTHIGLSQLPDLPPQAPLPSRIAMRVGLALLLWSSRPHRRRRLSPEEALLRRQNALERDEREDRMLIQRYFYGAGHP